VIALNQKGSLSLILETAKTQALAGAAAGAALGVLRSFVTVHRENLHDGYDVLSEGLTELGTGALLGAVSALAASATGATVAAIAGRGIWTVAAPLVVSTVTSNLAHKRVDRLVRPFSEDLVRGLKESLNDNFMREALPGPSRR
jgi:hypothetical protein